MASKGDIVSDIDSIEAGAYMDIQPGADAEWKIHNVYHAGTISLEYYDGSNQLEFVSSRTGPGVYAYFAYGCTNTIRVRVKNEDGSAKLIGYDGIKTK